MVRCKHGMEEEWCGFCQETKTKSKLKTRQPRSSVKKTVFGQGTVEIKDSRKYGFVIVIAKRGHPTLSELDKNTYLVHIQGRPYIWLLKLIIAKAPNVKKIQIIPADIKRITASHYSLCKKYGVEIVPGHWQPEMAWKKDEVRRNQNYKVQRKFFKSLSGEQKALFEELKTLGFEVVNLVIDYFDVDNNGQNYTYQQLADKYGFCHESHACEYIQATIYYLDPTFETAIISKHIAQTMRFQVSKLRLIFNNLKEQQEIAKRLGLTILPISMPLSKLEILEGILEAKRDGRLLQLEKNHPRRYWTLILRFGLDTDTDKSCYRVLEEVGILLGGVTKERARQLEDEALKILGIKDPEKLNDD